MVAGNSATDQIMALVLVILAVLFMLFSFFKVCGYWYHHQHRQTQRLQVEQRMDHSLQRRKPILFEVCTVTEEAMGLKWENIQVRTRLFVLSER